MSDRPNPSNLLLTSIPGVTNWVHGNVLYYDRKHRKKICSEDCNEDERRYSTLIVGHIESFQKGAVKNIKCCREESERQTEKCPVLT